ncbi:hypothetical protein Afil01_18400 [Actinorhabdospora filicis]|uniref:Uncharacterized protein n=1 Tax=Actinorhabdospora filicis TaxID=1785913 RepID=A0A9W6W8J2_9ACTN|nr:hypothetical protein [Actinorhabdospora filicis]GLZ77033.1 hypothetical protein Afil01_18400 [Actinorhabdospora filicis]
MTLRSLGEGLRDLADAVEPADLRDRALSASRRLRARRVVAGMGTAAVVLFALVLGVNAMLPGGSLPPPRDLAGDMAGPTASSSEGLNYTDSATDALGGITSMDKGTFFYLAEAATGGTMEVLRWTAGAATTTVVARDLPATGTEQLSPDGRYLSSVEKGRLQLRDLIAGTRHESIEVPDGQLCNIPTWTPTADRLLVATGPGGTSGPLGFVDVADDSYTQVSAESRGCHTYPSYGPTGDVELTFTAYAATSQSVARATLEGVITSSVAWDALPGDVLLDQVTDVSPDGGLVCVGLVPAGTKPGNLTGSQSRTCQAIGMWSGGFQRIEVGEPFSEALMLQNSFVTRTATNGGGSTLRLHDGTGAEIQRIGEPDLPDGSLLLGFVPG